MGARVGSATVALAAVAFAVLAGCGGDDDAGGAPRSPQLPERSPLMRIAIAQPVATIDPLYADSRGAALVSRQIYEPLISSESGPFADADPLIGPGRGLTSAAGGRQWRLRLRSGVRFQDGTLLDASVVTANVDRWIDSGIAAELLPGLIVAEGLRPGLVRFRFSVPLPDLAERLADPRLGLVPATAIAERGIAPIRAATPGTGPFELRERSPERLLLARNSEWWGSELGRGPGLERIELVVVPGEFDRIEQLARGEVAVADELGPLTARALGREPLLTAVRSGRAKLGLERSVRGIDVAEAGQSLADVWLTELR